MIFKVLYLNPDQGEHGRLPDLGIINAGGTIGPTFYVGGKPLLFADGTATDGSPTSIINVDLQGVYDNSSIAQINLDAGKHFTIRAVNSDIFTVNADTGKVTITGDLEVLGASTVIEGVLANVDQVIINQPSSGTTGLIIEPKPGVTPAVDLVRIRAVNAGPPVFLIDAAGNVTMNALTVSTINGINFTQFYNDFQAHIGPTGIKHAAGNISVAGPFNNIAGANVEAALASIDSQLGGGGGGGDVGGLFFINAAPTSSGIVADKQYVAGTVPANKVITQATTDTNNVTVTLLVEGGTSFYSPTVTITTVPPQVGGPITATLSEDPTDRRTFYATANISVPVDTVVNAVSSTTATGSCTIIRAAAGPAFSSLTIGALPGTQTEAKAGDLVPVTGVVENSATYAELLAGGANSALLVLTLGTADSAGVGFKTVSGTFTVGSGSGPQTVQARAQNTLGTFGATMTSGNSITLNQTYPTIGARTITYPIGQQALKGSETATIGATITNFDSVLYTGVNLSIASPTVYGVKSATRTGGSYIVGVNNYTITATKASNGAVSTASSAVSIADTAPTAAISIVGNPARLFSSPGGTDYTVTITANQQLLNAPVLSASAGTWQGTWSGSGTTWTRVLRIFDTDPKGAQTFSGMTITGLAGVTGNVITSGASYIIGGFAPRVITFAAFERYHAIGTQVTDFSKVTASYTGSSVLTRRSDTNDVFQSFTITDSLGVFNATGDHLFISDAAFAGSNTSGTLQLTVAEAA